MCAGVKSERSETRRVCLGLYPAYHGLTDRQLDRHTPILVSPGRLNIVEAPSSRTDVSLSLIFAVSR